MKKNGRQIIGTIAYVVGLVAISTYILVIFDRPLKGIHGTINSFSPSSFLDMINGTANRPYVYRTLLPTTIRLISLATPGEVHQMFNTTVEKYNFLNYSFMLFGWETSAAYEYGVAFILMLGCFVGFGHYTAKLVMQVCNLGYARSTRFLLAGSALLVLPVFFRYTSFIYDPPQLFLFTLALYFLATSRPWAFFITFIFCCINKETALLLIPLYALTGSRVKPVTRQYWGVLSGLVFVYLIVRGSISLIFRSNPGSVVEFQYLHNLDVLTRGWTLPAVIVFLMLILLLFYRWNEKPQFLKDAFLCIFPALIALSLFGGFIDEWRVYYEAYPIMFGLIVYSLHRLKHVLYPEIL